MTRDEFTAMLRPDGECLLWTGATAPNGYGRFSKTYAHRLAHELFIGPIPDGYQIDHVAERGCRNRLCCRREHLEAVPQVVNIRRQANVIDQMARTHCPHGHPYSPGNTARRRGKRECRTCVRQRVRRLEKRRHARLLASGHTTKCTAKRCSQRCVQRTGVGKEPRR